MLNEEICLTSEIDNHKSIQLSLLTYYFDFLLLTFEFKHARSLLKTSYSRSIIL
jgi:hypothetical protein